MFNNQSLPKMFLYIFISLIPFFQSLDGSQAEKNSKRDRTKELEEMMQDAHDELKNENVKASMQMLHDVVKSKDLVPLIIKYAASNRYAHGKVLESPKSRFNCLCLLPDNKIALGLNDTSVRIWKPYRSVTDNEHCIILGCHDNSVLSACVLPDGRVISGSKDRTMRIWDPTKKTTDNDNCVVLSCKSSMSKICAYPDGKVLSVSKNGTVRVWYLSKKRTEKDFSVVLSCSRNILESSLCILPDGRIAYGVNSDNKVCIYDMSEARRNEFLTWPEGWVISLCTFSDGRFASCSFMHDTVSIWHKAKVETNKILKGHDERVTIVCVLPDDRVASGSADKTVRVWSPATDPTDENHCEVLKGHEARIHSLCAFPDGKLVSGSTKEVIVWEAAPSHLELVWNKFSEKKDV